MPETKPFFVRMNDTETGEIEAMLRALAAADLRSMGDENIVIIRNAFQARFPSPTAVSAETLAALPTSEAFERPADPAIYQLGQEG